MSRPLGQFRTSKELPFHKEIDTLDTLDMLEIGIYFKSKTYKGLL